MTRNQILEAKEDPRSKDELLSEWEARRAAYTIGVFHKEMNKRMRSYFVARWQSDYEDGYKGVHRPEFEDFNVFVKQGIDLDR